LSSSLDALTTNRGTGLTENTEGPAHTAGQQKQEQDLGFFTSQPHERGLCSLWGQGITSLRRHLQGSQEAQILPWADRSCMIHASWGREQEPNKEIINLSRAPFIWELVRHAYLQVRAEGIELSLAGRQRHQVTTLLHCCGPLFFSAIQNTFHCCSFLCLNCLLYLETWCSNQVALHAHPQAMGAFSRASASSTANSSWATSSCLWAEGTERLHAQKHTRQILEQPDLRPGHAEEHQQAWYCETHIAAQASFTRTETLGIAIPD